MVRIERETAAHGAAVESLLDLSFGAERHLKTCQRLRDGRAPAFALVARSGGRVVGTISFWDVDAGGVPALLLGPVAVHPGLRGRGLGAKLIEAGLAQAAEMGQEAIILVGDPEYYERFGFSRALTLGLDMPGWVEERRFLGLGLVPGALAFAVGPVAATGTLLMPERVAA